MASNLVNKKRSRLIDLIYHPSKDFMSSGVINLEYITAEHNITHMMT